VKSVVKLFTIMLTMLILPLEAQDNLSAVFKGKTNLKNPLDLRDPFKKTQNKKRHHTKDNSVSAISGVFKNYDDSIEGRPISSIKITGVLIGEERRAMAQINNGNEKFVLKEGMIIGQNKAEVKAILPGGVILVEKIRNVYDQDEYLETVLPVSGD